MNAPADGVPRSKTCERFRLRVFFCVMRGGKALRVEQSPTPTMNRERMLMCGKVTHKNLIDGSPYSEKRKLKIFHFPY